ncbi:TadE/TadG family type IV pilus assembly protein [Flaviflagellibacter deserti]|jgi:Flp pilus assembly protein TadG|uniref:TadE/TadG family type IV pilus assembly protein n=1 Tax=Flaviflagellibacter deserti TaxID=2267266 RepID=A0ABV9Z172_9HYPH
MDQKKPRTDRLKRFARSNDGATAVEFALIAPLFLSLMLTIMYSGLTLFANSVLQTMVDRAARQVRIGQLQNATQQQFLNAICDSSKSEILFTCSKIRAQSRLLTDPANAACFSRTTEAPASCFTSGTGGNAPSMVLIQATYEWPLPLTIRLWDPPQQEQPNQTLANTMLVATTVIQNEPW